MSILRTNNRRLSQHVKTIRFDPWQALNAAETGQEDNFYPYEETLVEYLFVTEKYLPDPRREKFVNVAR